MKLRGLPWVVYFILILLFTLQVKGSGVKIPEVSSGKVNTAIESGLLNGVVDLRLSPSCLLHTLGSLPLPSASGAGSADSGKSLFLGPWKLMRKNLYYKWDWEEDFWIIYKEKGKVFIWDVQPSYRCEGEIKGNTLKCKWYSDIGEFITTITFSEDGKSFTGETNFNYWLGGKGKELLRGFRKRERVDLSETSKEEIKGETVVLMKEILNDGTIIIATELKPGTALPLAAIKAKKEHVKVGKHSFSISIPSRSEYFATIEGINSFAIIRNGTLLSEWKRYKVNGQAGGATLEASMKEVGRKVVKYVWENKYSIIGSAVINLIAPAVGAAKYLGTVTVHLTKQGARFLGKHYDDIMNYMRSKVKVTYYFHDTSTVYGGEPHRSYANAMIKSSVIVKTTDEGVVSIYVLEGEAELSDAAGRKTVKIPVGYYSKCRKGEIPMDPMPFNRKDIEKLWPISEQMEGVVAKWNFDEGRGSTISDIANQNHGRIHGAHWTDGISGRSLVFDGVDDYVEVPHSPILCPSEAFTISAWIRQRKLDSSDRTIIAKGLPSASFSNYDLRIFRGKVRFLFKNISGSWAVYSTKGQEIYPGRWTHIAVVHVWGKPSRTGIYVDGKRVPGEWTFGNGYEKISSIVSPLYISGTGRLLGFNGAIDEVSIWNTALNSEEIKNVYGIYSIFPSPSNGKFSRTQHPSINRELLFYGDFERVAPGPNWRVQKGIWKIEQGNLRAVGKKE